MNVTNDLRLAEGEEIVVPLQITRPIFKPFTSIRRLIQLMSLNHGAHRTIKHQNARGENLFKFGSFIFDFFKHVKPGSF